MNRTAYNSGGSRQKNEYPDLKAQIGEDPARFLETNELTATARIRGIRDPELLEAYELVDDEITAGQYRKTILETIDERKVALGIGDELAEPEPEPTPVPATDGGTVEISDDSGKTSHDLTTTAESDEATSSPSDSASDSIDDVHPDVRGLEAGQVLELERADGTEYIFPAQPDADEPFLCRSFDAEGDERTADPITLTLGEVASRPINDTDPKPASEVDVRAPKLAAMNGGDSA